MFGFFTKKVEKEEFEQLRDAVQTGFNNVKQDFEKTTKWIKHLHSKGSDHNDDISDIHDELTTIKEDLENLKNLLSIIGDRKVFKQPQTVFNKQTPVYDVLNSVQTGVQTVFLDNLTSNERAIIFILLNSDMRLSYEDLAAMMGKRKSTIRGQINSIRQKSEGLIEEIVEVNNKKRVYIDDRTKEMLLKSRKAKGKNRKSEDGERKNSL